LSLPISLPNGVVAIYGTGKKVSPSGITLMSESSEIRFGYIDSIYSGAAVFVYGGDAVMFKDSDVIERIRYNNYPYTLVPLRLVTKEAPLL